MDYILTSLTEVADILLTTRQADYKSVSPELVCVPDYLSPPPPPIYMLKPFNVMVFEGGVFGRELGLDEVMRVGHSC